MTTRTYQKAFAAVRRTEGRDWMDTETIRLLREMTAESAKATDERVPSWATHNPVVRIVSIYVSEDYEV